MRAGAWPPARREARDGVHVLTTIGEMSDARQRWQERGGFGLRPTLALSAPGLLSLARGRHAESATTVASIFVNPAQFGPGEDLARYPRDLPRDLAQLESAGVEAVFVPTAEEMYPAGFSTYVVPEGTLAARLEAAARPGHFRGVATVVAKLFAIVRPTDAYFGQKDAQQVAVLRRMIVDLHLPVRLRVLPTVREADGLAMSSRNAYLDREQRTAATVLFRALQAGRAAFDAPAAGGAHTARPAPAATGAARPPAPPRTAAPRQSETLPAPRAARPRHAHRAKSRHTAHLSVGAATRRSKASRVGTASASSAHCPAGATTATTAPSASTRGM